MLKTNELIAIPTSTVTRDLREPDVKAGNMYESIVVISMRAA